MPASVESFGPFVIIQLAVAGAMAAGIGLAIWRGVAGKPKQEATAGPAVQWFFDGPITKVIGLLEGIYREMIRAREDRQRLADERNKKQDEMIDLLRELKERLPLSRRH